MNRKWKIDRTAPSLAYFFAAATRLEDPGWVGIEFEKRFFPLAETKDLGNETLTPN